MYGREPTNEEKLVPVFCLLLFYIINSRLNKCTSHPEGMVELYSHTQCK